MTEQVLSQVLELDLDRCQNTFGVSPCTAGRVESGTAQAGASTTLTLRAGASAVDSAYNNMTARLTGAAGSVQERKISGYVGATKVATVAKPWVRNLILRSEEFDNAAWQKLNSGTGVLPVVTANAGTAPDGTATADRIQLDLGATPTTAASRLFQNAGLAPGTGQCARALYLKTNDGSTKTVYFFTTAPSTYGLITVTPTWQRISGLDTSNQDLPSYGQIQFGLAGTGFIPIPSNTDTTADILAWGGQLEIATELGDYVKTVAAITALPDATTTYDVIDRPNACYNTYRSCLAKPTYVKGTQTLRFTGVGSPIDKTAPAWPYITNVQRAVTELVPEDGLARRSSSTITLVDEQVADVDQDPYILDRATPAGGTYWTRLLARTLNYTGRWARVKRGYVNQGVFGSYATELYIIEKIAGPNGAGELQLTLKDPTKLADRSTTPTPTSGKLLIDVGTNDLALPLNAGEGAQYPSSGWVRIGDEVIRYSSNAVDILSLSSSTYRANFSTTVAAAQAGDGVQLCTVWQDQPWSTVIKALLNNAGLIDANIDVAGIQSEDTTWLGLDYRVTRCLSDPQDNAELLTDLLQAAQAMLWWDPETQKATVKVYAPQSPSLVVAKTLDESGYLMDRSVATQRLDDERITLAAVYFGLRSAVINVDESKNYKFGEVTIDVDAESANEYNARRVKTFYVPWFGSANLLGMRTHSRRYVARHRDAPENVSFELHVKDNDLTLGQIADVQSKALVSSNGATRTARVLITRKDNTGAALKIGARVTTFDRRPGFIAPAATPNYPANNDYACASSAAGLMSDGSAGYLII